MTLSSSKDGEYDGKYTVLAVSGFDSIFQYFYLHMFGSLFSVTFGLKLSLKIHKNIQNVTNKPKVFTF